jgi:hypothetical protein
VAETDEQLGRKMSQAPLDERGNAMAKFVGILALAAAALNASPAYAVTKSCDGHSYGGIDPNAFPNVQHLRVIDLPPKTDGYAPPCLVAESVAGLVQYKWRQSPKVVWARGARWNGGLWHVTYQFQKTRDGGYMKMTARKDEQRITADLMS